MYRLHIHAHICIHTHIHTYTHTYARTRTHTHTHTHTQIRRASMGRPDWQWLRFGTCCHGSTQRAPSRTRVLGRTRYSDVTATISRDSMVEKSSLSPKFSVSKKVLEPCCELLRQLLRFFTRSDGRKRADRHLKWQVESWLTPSDWPVESRLTPRDWPVESRLTPSDWPVESRLTPSDWPVESRLTPSDWQVESRLTPSDWQVETWNSVSKECSLLWIFIDDVS